MGVRAQQKERTRRSLIEAAFSQLSAERSFASLSLREVSREAGIAPTSFYRHFRDVDELGLTMVDESGLMLRQLMRQARQRIAKGGSVIRTSVSTFMEFIGNPIIAMFIAVFVAYYVLGLRRHMGMSALLSHTESGFSSIANILLIIGAGGAFNSILKTSGLADTLALMLSNLHMHPILLAWLVALILHAAVGSATVAMMGATAIVAPMLSLYPNVSPEIVTIAIGSGAIGCTIVTDSLFWLVKQYCGATLNETFKYYTTATFIASVLALGMTFLLSYVI